MIEQTIHERFAASAGLVALLPTERFTTGNRLDDPETELPAAVLDLQSTSKRYVNTHHLKESDIRLKVWVRDHADGVAIREELENVFDNTDWVGTKLRVIKSRIEDDSAIQEDDGVWQFLFTLSVISKKIPS